MNRFSSLLVLLSLAIGCGDSSDGEAANPNEGETGGPSASGKTHPSFVSVAVDPLSAPLAPAGCITDVSAGDHKFNCDGITYLVLVDEQCTKKACGVIFDVHGATMSGLQQRDNTLLHETAPKAGFIYVNPSKVDRNTGGTWALGADPQKVVLVLDQVVQVFRANPKRIHFTGFSQGGITTFHAIANRNALLASAAPVAGAIGEQTWANDAWKPRIPLLIMNGATDAASTIQASDAMVAQIVQGLGLTGGEQIKGDGHYTWKKWTGADNGSLEYIVHDYGGQAVLAGHCIPGGIDVEGGANNGGALNATTCTTGDIQLNWGDTVLQWFIDHPKP